MYAYDAGSRYIVKTSNLDAAYRWLEDEGEFAHKVGADGDRVVLSADGYEDMFCGEVSPLVGGMVVEFMVLFCEVGSYACHHLVEYNEYTLYWKDGNGVHSETKEVGNPFASSIRAIETLWG